MTVGLEISAVEIPEEDKKKFLELLEKKGGKVKVNDFLQALNEEYGWEVGYSLLVLTQLFDEGKIGYGKVKVGRPGPRPLCVWIQDEEV